MPNTTYAAPCQQFTSHSQTPSGWASAFDIIQDPSRLLLSADCGTSLDIYVGRGNQNHIIYDQGYWWDGSSWVQFTYNGNRVQAGEPWLAASANKSSLPVPQSLQESGTFVVAYICTLTNNQYKCGCSTQACSSDTSTMWSIQQINATDPVDDTDTDTDNDGVPDDQDDCPNESGSPQNDGCPVDDGGDGVPAGDFPEVQLPSADDFVDRGVIMTGASGQWDARLQGAMSPATVIKRGDTLYIYYIAAEGSCSTDGGPAFRRMGVLTAPARAPANISRHSNNPIINHFPGGAGGVNTEEEGVYSAAAVVKNGRVYLYYSGLEAVGDTPVDSDIRLAESSNGVSFGNHCDLIRGTDGDPGHDEIFPLGAIELNDNWHVYWSNRANSSYPDWAMMYSSGSSPGNIGSIGQARRIRAPSSGKLTSFGDPIRISDTEIMVPVKTNFGTNESIDFLTAPVSNPGNLSRRSTVRWSGLLHGTLYLDREEGQWLLYYYRSTRQRPAEVKDSSGYI